MREEKTGGRTKSFLPNLLMSKKISLVTVFAWAYILPQNNTYYQNQQKQLTITRTKWEEMKRGTKRQKFKWAAGTVSQG